MQYMTFRASCSYAGVANMLALQGVNVSDREIALGMKLPYLFSQESGCYLSGPMLQSAQWFNLYLHPIGFHMTETEVAASELPDFLSRASTAMLGLHVGTEGKHAVVYAGYTQGKFRFVNNKHEQDLSPEEILLGKKELLQHLDDTVMVARLENISQRPTDVDSLIRHSPEIIRRNVTDIHAVASRNEAIALLRTLLHPLFRALLLDGVTMLELLQETALAQKLSSLQRQLLAALRQNDNSQIMLRNFFSLQQLTDAAEEYIRLIEQAAMVQ